MYGRTVALGMTGLTLLAVAARVPTAKADSAATTTSSTRTVAYAVDGKSAHFTFLGKDANHPRPGDRIVEHATLTQHGKRVGRLLNTCTVVIGGAHGDNICEEVLEVTGGQLVLGGSGNPRVVPITGGSGRFAYATGTVLQQPTSSGGRFTVRYRTTQ